MKEIKNELLPIKINGYQKKKKLLKCGKSLHV